MRKLLCVLGLAAVCWGAYASAANAAFINVDQGRFSRLGDLAGFDAYVYACRNGSYEEARFILDDLIYNYPEETYLYYLRSLVFAQMEDLAGARADAACYSQYEQGDIDGYKLNVYVCFEDKAYADAMYYCRRGLEINPDNTYLLKYEKKLAALIEEENRRESFESIGMGEESCAMREVLDFINEKRQSAGIGNLQVNALLNQAAQVRADELKTLFSHTRLDGSPFLSVLKEFGIQYHFAGELVYKAAGTPEEMAGAWKRRYADRDFGMDPETRYVGIGFAEEDGATYLALLFIF